MRSDRLMSNLIITGFSGTGKSRVAGEVARRLGWDLIDTDDEIVRGSGKAIAEIFHEDGEGKFRELEREIVSKACQQSRTVIAIGGGAIIDSQNYELLVRSGLIVCLEAKAGTIQERLFREAASGSGTEVRPLLATDNPLERIRQLKAARQPYYADVDWTVHTDNLSIDQVAEEVIRAWRLLGGAHPHLNPLPSRERRQDGQQGAVSAAERQRTSQLEMDRDVACRVETATRSCPVFVGYTLLDKLGEKMRQAGLSGTAIIISDENVFPLYGHRVTGILGGAGFAVHSFVMPPGEETKNIGYATRIYDFLVERRVERDDVIIALGGGVVGDLAGFVAATFLRGMPWVQVPTSLVAMVDASIGGKVGVDHPEGKNLIGAFYQPHLVLADPEVLATLSQRELISGWAEVIKHGLILDEGLVESLEINARGLRELEPELLTTAIARSAAIKARVVSQDETERAGKRILLNYGHTIAHGLEAATGYRSFLHGEAVAMGMMGAARLSERLGLLPAPAVERQRALLNEFGLPVSLPSKGRVPRLSLAGIAKAMTLDKKVRNRAIRWVLLEGIGKAVVRADVPQQDVRAVLRGLLKQ